MFSLELPVSLLAVLFGLAVLSVSAWVLLRYRTRVLRLFTFFDSAIFGMTLGFFLRSLGSGLSWLAPGSAQQAWLEGLILTLGSLAFVVQAAGALILVLVLPAFCYSLFGKQPGPVLQRSALVSGAVLASLVVWYLVSPDKGLAGLALSGLLLGNIGLALITLGVLLFPREGRIGGSRSGARMAGSSMDGAVAGAGQTRGTESGPGREPDKAGKPGAVPDGSARNAGGGEVPAGADRIPRAILIRLLVITLCFLPLFVADMVMSSLPPDPLTRIVDNTSLPLYFLLLNLGLAVLLRRFLDQPPLMEGDTVSEHAIKTYHLTAREAQVLEYVMDGYTVKDLAGVLGISPKTAENHLYAVYQKTGVTNRIQLFQFFQNQRSQGPRT